MTNFSLTDQPILDASHDKLDRHPFAKLIAMELLSDLSCNSGVVGLTGSWGSGKSSVANLVEKEIGDNATVVRFEPWMIGSREALVQEFFITLGKGAFPNSKSKEQKEARERYLEFASRIANQFGPVAIALVQTDPKLQTAGLLIKVASNIDKVIQIFKKAASEPTLKESRDAIATDLEKIEKPVIVVIDDIDRLDKTEVKTVFQLVKACADFPKVKYLLLYDRDQVLHALQDSVNNPEAFLEKIVNQVFDLPEATTQQRGLLLQNSIESLQLQKDLLHIDAARLTNVIHTILLPGLPTVRHVKRYIKTARTLLPGVTDEEGKSVDPSDFLVLEFLRQYLPSLYEVLRSESVPNASGNLDETAKKDIRDKAINSLEKQPKILGESCFSLLFPKEKNLFEDFEARRLRVEYWRPVYFGFSSARAVLNGVVWRGFLDKLSSNEEIDQWIDDWNDLEKREKWVTAITARASEIPLGRRADLIAKIFKWGDQQGPNEPIDANQTSRGWADAMTNCCQSILLASNQMSDRYAILIQAIQSSQAFVSPLLLISKDYVVEYGRRFETLDLSETINRLSDKLNTDLISNEFWNYSDPGSFIRAWSILERQQYKDWLASLSAVPTQLIKYVNLVLGRSILTPTYSITNYPRQVIDAIKILDPQQLNDDGRRGRDFIIMSEQKELDRL